jgi:hypothetical protein
MDVGEVIACNCSRCGKLGSLLAFAPLDKLKVLSGEEDLQTYKFNKNVINHQFCKVCGIEPFALAKNPRSGEDVAAVNVRCLDGIDVSKLVIKQVDGKSF